MAPLLKRAQKAVHAARKTIKKEAGAATVERYLRSQRAVTRARNRKDRRQRETDLYSKWIGKMDARYAAAKGGLLGTRWIRKKFWENLQDAVTWWEKKRAKKLKTLDDAAKITETAFRNIYGTEKKRLETERKDALDRLNDCLDSVADRMTETRAVLQERINFIQAANNNLNPAQQLPVPLFDQLRTKVTAEAGNTNRRTGAFRVVQIHKGMGKLENLVSLARRTEAENEINRLIGFSVNPPA